VTVHILSPCVPEAKRFCGTSRLSATSSRQASLLCLSISASPAVSVYATMEPCALTHAAVNRALLTCGTVGLWDRCSFDDSVECVGELRWCE
jgi:hypothetical protein